jgi:segregation and condensation protein A
MSPAMLRPQSVSEVPSSAEAAFIVDVDGFEGPIDVLLTLARAQRVDLARLSIVRLADQYLDFVARLRGRHLPLAAEYLVMAAWLAYLKSRLLLPKPLPERDEPEPEVVAAALARQLAQLEGLRRAGQRLFAQPQLGRDTFLRPVVAVAGEAQPPLPRVTLAALITAYVRSRQRATLPPSATIAPLPLLAVEEALAHVQARLAERPGWQSLLSFVPAAALDAAAHPLAPRAALAATFVAALELARTGGVTMRQNRAFGPIFVTAGNGRDG